MKVDTLNLIKEINSGYAKILKNDSHKARSINHKPYFFNLLNSYIVERL